MIEMVYEPEKMSLSEYTIYRIYFNIVRNYVEKMDNYNQSTFINMIQYGKTDEDDFKKLKKEYLKYTDNMQPFEGLLKYIEITKGYTSEKFLENVDMYDKVEIAGKKAMENIIPELLSGVLELIKSMTGKLYPLIVTIIIMIAIYFIMKFFTTLKGLI